MLETKSGKRLALEPIVWQDAILQIESVHPKLARIMENLIGGDQVFYKARYKFGDTIIKAGEWYLPVCNSESISFQDNDIPEKLKQDLVYDPVTEDPLGLILTKTSEFYMTSGDRVLPHSLAIPGYIFGIPRAIHDIGNVPVSALSWDLNAGSRSLFILSPINNKTHHANLAEHYGIKLDAPSSLKDHWQIFVNLANKVKNDWDCEILYFPRNIINSLKLPKFAELSMHLTRLHRSTYNVWHNMSAIWNNAFGDIEQARRLAAYPMYSVATAKHMFVIAAKSSPAFKPATNDNSAPIKLLQDIYANTYGLTAQNHSAVIMEPTIFNHMAQEAVYYSLNYPTFTQNNLELSRKKSQISLLDEIRVLIDIFQDTILTSKQHVKSLFDVGNNVTFSYYHSNPENYRHILNASTIKDNDKSFLNNQTGEFPHNSPFFKGCIKIESKKL